MAITRVAGSHAETRYTNSALPRTLAFGGALTPGSLLVVKIATFNSGITLTVSDSVNGAYTQAGPYGGSSTSRASIWYFENNGSSGTPTVTITPSAAAYISISIDEYLGAKTSGALRATDTKEGTGTARVVGPVAASGGDLVDAVISDGTTSACTSVDAPFTLVTNLSGSIAFQTIYTAYDLAAPGSESCTFNKAATTGAWAGAIAAFEAEAVAADRLMTNFVTDTILLRQHHRVAYGEQ